MAPRRNRVSKRSSKGKASSSSSSSSKPKNTTPTTRGDPNGPILFWRPRESSTGYLSQWYSSHPFRDRDPESTKIYATAEHYMMHHKALLFGDSEIASAILEVPASSSTGPRDVRALGRAVKGFDEAVWARERVRIVTEGSWCKFSLPVVDNNDNNNNTAEVVGEGEGKGEVRMWALGDGEDAETVRATTFREVLLATGDRELVEASPFDKIWGIGFAAKNAEAHRAKWGMNLLGKCLMDVRAQFRREEEEKKKKQEEEAQEVVDESKYEKII